MQSLGPTCEKCDLHVNFVQYSATVCVLADMFPFIDVHSVRRFSVIVCVCATLIAMLA